MQTLVTVILIGICMAVVIAIHLHLTARPGEPLIVPSTDDIDAEFFRIVGHEWLGQQDRNA